MKSEITENVFRERLERYAGEQGPNIDYDKLLKGEGVPNSIKEILEYYQVKNANGGEIKKAQEPSRESLRERCIEINKILFYKVFQRLPWAIMERVDEIEKETKKDA